MMTLLAVENTFLGMNLHRWNKSSWYSLEKLKQKSLKYIKHTEYFHSFLIFNLICPWQNWVLISGLIKMTHTFIRKRRTTQQISFLCFFLNFDKPILKKIAIEIWNFFVRNQPSQSTFKCSFKLKYLDWILPTLSFVFIQILQLLI